jgi:hypothetical protein
MHKSHAIRVLLIAGVVSAAVSVPAGAHAGTANEKRSAAAISTSTANAMQAAAVARGEANSALSNPYIEQKVTTAESVGVNRTRIPAGGF